MFLNCIGTCSYWSQAVKSHKIVLELNHTFQKQTGLTQFEIASVNGVQKLSVPTIKSTRKGPYSKVALSYETNWQTEHWRSIENAYLKSPFFVYYNYKIEPVFSGEYNFLYEFNYALFQVLCKCLKIEVEPVLNLEKQVYFEEEPKQNIEEYPQVFDYKHAFAPDLSVLDVLFNLGPEASDYLRQFPDKRP